MARVYTMLRREFKLIPVRTVERRSLVAAHDTDDAWNPKCPIREKLIQFCSKNTEAV